MSAPWQARGREGLRDFSLIDRATTPVYGLLAVGVAGLPSGRAALGAAGVGAAAGVHPAHLVELIELLAAHGGRRLSLVQRVGARQLVDDEPVEPGVDLAVGERVQSVRAERPVPVLRADRGLGLGRRGRGATAGALVRGGAVPLVRAGGLGRGDVVVPAQGLPGGNLVLDRDGLGAAAARDAADEGERREGEGHEGHDRAKVSHFGLHSPARGDTLMTPRGAVECPPGGERG